jgi:integrase
MTLLTQLEAAVIRSRKLRPRTRELYLHHARAFAAFVESKPEASSDLVHVAAWRDFMLKELSPRSVNVALNALRYAAERAKLDSLAEAARACQLKVKPPPRRLRALTWDQGRALVEACAGSRGRDIRDAALITLGLRTGMLRFSICQIKIADVDLEKSELRFVKKGGQTHTISLDDETRAALAKWIDWLRSNGVTSGFLFRSLGRPRVDPSDRAIGPQLTPDGFYRVLRARGRRVGFRGMRPRTLAVTFLAWAKQVGAQPDQITAVTGYRAMRYGDRASGGPAWPPANHLLPPWTARKLPEKEPNPS